MSEEVNLNLEPQKQEKRRGRPPKYNNIGEFREVQNNKSKKYYQDNPEKVKAYNKKYHEERKEKRKPAPAIIITRHEEE